MKLREVFIYEIEHRLRSKSTWFYLGFLFLLSIWMFLATADGDGAVNAPERVAGGATLVCTLGLIVSAALFGDASVRDVSANMDALLYTSSMRKIDYLGGRFLAALVANAVLALAIPLGFLAATLLTLSNGFENAAPLQLMAFVQPYILFLLPNLVLAGAILFTIGALSRKVVAVYLGAIGLFVATLVSANLGTGITNPVLGVLSDPLGIATIQKTTRYWTEAERAIRLLGFPVNLVLHRLTWVGIAGAVLFLLHRRFRFAHAGVSSRNDGVTPDGTLTERTRAVEVPRVAGSFGRGTAWRQMRSVAGQTLAELMGSPWFAVVLLACTGLTLLWGFNVNSTVFDTSTVPNTLLVAGTAIAERARPLIYALVALYAGEMVWKDRDANVDEMMDAAPLSEGTAVLGRFMALVALIAVFLIAQLVGGILIQVLQGYYHFEFDVYAQVLAIKFADYVLFAVLAMTVQVLVNHKYLGHIALAALLLSAVMLQMLQIVDHHLLIYGTDPGWLYSDLHRLSPFVASIISFRLYWGAWALMLGVISVLFWVRGPTAGAKSRLRRAWRRLAGPVARVAALAAVLIVTLGGFVFYNTNILNEYVSPRRAGEGQANYEKRYARYATLPQPTITSVKMRAEIHPEGPGVDFSGTYQLVNQGTAPIESVHVRLDPRVEVRTLAVGNAQRPAHDDAEVGYRIFTLDRPLAPGDSVPLAFDVSFRPRGFSNESAARDLVTNGSYFHRFWMPFIGYQPFFELQSAEVRSRFGLPPRRPLPGANDVDARKERDAVRDSDQIHLDAVLGTSIDQTAITPGVLQREWTENGRRYFHYVTETPIPFGATIFSARYARVDDRWTPPGGTGQPVALSIFYHPDHSANLDRVMRSMKASLDYFTTEFGPYPYSYLRVVERPRTGSFGTAHPGTLAFSEDAFFSDVKEGEVDQPFYGTAHEVAHHWWSGMVGSAPVRGIGFLSESMANYSAMMLMEETFGPQVAKRVFDFQMERYLVGRATQGNEVPLLDVEDQPYIAYRKGAIAMYMLRERIGAEAVSAAVRRFYSKHYNAGPPYPTSRDLYAELRAATPDSLHTLLRDWFETVTVWDVRATRAIATPRGDGTFEVTMDVRGRKARADRAGNLSEVPMEDDIEIGVFAPGLDGARGEQLYLQRHRIRSGPQTIRITVSKEPGRAGIDPYNRMIDRERTDNLVDVNRR